MTDSTQKPSAKGTDRAGTITETAAPGLQKGNGIQTPVSRPSGAIAPVKLSEGGGTPGLMSHGGYSCHGTHWHGDPQRPASRKVAERQEQPLAPHSRNCHYGTFPSCPFLNSGLSRVRMVPEEEEMVPK